MDASLVKELRDKTNAGMMDCKKALIESAGDLEKAVDILRKKGIATAAKRADKEAKEGLVCAHVSADGKLGVLIELNCETDFVAKNEGFASLANTILNDIVKASSKDIKNNTIVNNALKESIDKKIINAVGKIGEKICLKRFVKYETTGKIGSYIHLGGKLGILLEVEGNASAELLKDLCMQIAAAHPDYINSSEVPANVLEKEKEIIKAQIKGKPDNIVDKIVMGKLSKFYEEKCLIEQIFIKDNDKKVKNILGAVTVKRFSRFQIGAQ